MAEMVSEQLDKKLRDNFRDPRNSMFTGEGVSASQLRSVLGRDEVHHIGGMNSGKVFLKGKSQLLSFYFSFNFPPPPSLVLSQLTHSFVILPFSSLSLFLSPSPSLISFSRPLLVIFDRSVDLATLLHHTWTYQALCHDVFVSYVLVRCSEHSVGANFDRI